MEFSSGVEIDLTPTDHIRQMASSVIREINEIFQQIQTVVIRRKNLLIKEVSLIETKLRREKDQRCEDVNTLVRARESLEEVLNTNKYKNLRNELLIRLDDSLERENEQSTVDGFRFISTGINQLKDCISKFGVVVRNGLDEDFQGFGEDVFHSYTLPTRHLASPRISRKWPDPEHMSLMRQVSTPTSSMLTPTSRPRGATKPDSSTLSLSTSLYNTRDSLTPTHLGVHSPMRKNSFSH